MYLCSRINKLNFIVMKNTSEENLEDIVELLLGYYGSEMK